MDTGKNTVAKMKENLEKVASGIVNRMNRALDDPQTTPTMRVRIYEIVMDRLMGKPEATIRLEDSTADMEDAEKFVEMMAEEIRREFGDE